MAEIILAAIDQKRGAREQAETKWSSFKTPLTYRWLTRFRSMLSRTELKNVCACVRLTLSGAFSIVWSVKVSTLNDVVPVGDSLAITTFDKMELDEFWEQSNSTRSLWHTELISRECWLFSNSKAGKSWEALLDSHSATGWVDLSDVHGFLVSNETVVLRRWGRSKQKFGSIKRVDKGWITTVKDLESFLNLSRW